MDADTDDHLSDAALARELVVVGASTAARVRSGGQALGISAKSNVTDVVTAADRAAEEAMARLVRLHRPADALLGEEGARRDGTSGRTWVMDPLDGTYNFTRGHDRWCSAVALLVDDVPVLGAIAPAVGDPWFGGEQVPAACGSQRLGPLPDVGLGASSLLTYLHPPHHATAVGTAWRRLAGAVATLRMTGSGSLDAVDVASGRAELSVQHSVPMWDSAPGEALVLSVGGEARRINAAGVEWFLLGTPMAVAEAAELLADR